MGVNKMKRNTKIALIILALSLMVNFFLGKLKPEPDKSVVEAKPPVVATTILKKVNTEIQIESQGMVSPLVETVLSAEVSGTIIELSPKFVAGGIFKKGEVLMQIDPTTYSVALEQAQALKNQRQNEFEDSVKIRKQGFLSESEYLSAVTALAVAESGLVQAQRNLDKTKIVLPYDGMVRAKSADLGQYVNVGKQLGVTFATEYAEIRLPLSSQDVVYADLPTSSEISGQNEFVGPKVTFTLNQASNSLERAGYIVRSEGVVDEKTRMTFAVARLEDPYNLKNITGLSILPMGAFVSASIKPDQSYQFFKIPRSAIINNRQIITIDNSSRIYYQTVELIRADKNYGYVSDGIQDGQRISMTSLEDGINGMEVRINQK